MVYLRTREDWKALHTMLSVAATIFAIIYLVGSVGAYENDLITTQQFLLRIVISFALIIA